MKRNFWKKALAAAAAITMLCAAAFAEETVDVILTSKTTQAFSDQPVSSDDLNRILSAGLSATSAMNQQPWFFVSLTDKEIMNEIAGSMSMGGGAPAGAPGEAPAGAPEGAAAPPATAAAKAALGDSPLAIIIYVDEDTMSTDASFDCGLACQNMVIAANALGYGTKIVSSPTIALNGDSHDELCEKLGVDDSMDAVAVLLIGPADETADGVTSATTRYSIDEKVSFID